MRLSLAALLPALSLAALFLAAQFLAAPLSAQDRPEPPEGRPPPPSEAFQACSDQDEGSLCAFEAPFGTVEGVCRAPRGDRLVCVPNHPPRRPRQ